MKEINIKEAKELLEKNKNNGNFIIIDVRSPEEFAKGHIEGAVNISLSCIGGELCTLDKDKVYFIYCYSGMRSKNCVELMERAGFGNIFCLNEGFFKWS